MKCVRQNIIPRVCLSNNTVFGRSFLVQLCARNSSQSLNHKFDSHEALSAIYHCVGETVSSILSVQGDCLKMKGTEIFHTNSLQRMFPAKGTSAHRYV
jgi:hypothetical protein